MWNSELVAWRHGPPTAVHLLCVFLTLSLSSSRNPAWSDEPVFHFADVSASAGVDFRHQSPPTAERHIHLSTGSGIGWIDFDGDDWPDMYCGQGNSWDAAAGHSRLDFHDSLLRNRHGKFVEVAEPAGVKNTAYATGVATGDFDNDGFPDVFVSCFGKNCLHRNNGDGTFTQITDAAGVTDRQFGTSCTWADIDDDGDLDLVVLNYLAIDPLDYPICSQEYEGKTVYLTCHPRFQKAAHDILYRNEGDGTFTDISELAGVLADEPRQGFGVVAADLDDDGDVDFYVANDTVPNQLWLNDGNGNFTEEGLICGVALNRRGAREAGMGLAAGDVDGSGTIDLFVTNYFNETNTFYRNEGASFFLDITDEIGLASPSLARLGFGTSLSDWNNDGWLDLFVANGHVNDQLHLLGRNSEPFAQHAQVFVNRKGIRFEDVSQVSGEYFAEPVVGRSTAVADYDRDGRPDVGVQHLNDRLVLLRNESAATAVSVRVKLIGTRTSRTPVASSVAIQSGKQLLSRFQQGSGSFLGCDESAMTIGLGTMSSECEVTVRWASGRRETWSLPDAQKTFYLVEGRGEPVQ